MAVSRVVSEILNVVKYRDLYIYRLLQRLAKNGDYNSVHVFSLDSVGVRSRCLDLMPGTVRLVS